jgi:hypothetical protein
MGDLDANNHVNRMPIVLEVLDYRWLCYAALKVVLVRDKGCCRDFFYLVNGVSCPGSISFNGGVEKVGNDQAHSQLETFTVINLDFNIRFGISLENFIGVDGEWLLCEAELRI